MNKKVLASLGLAVAVVATAMPAMAYTNSIGAVTETQDIEANQSANCTVYAEVGSEFKVTIPKHIVLDGVTKTGAYTVSVTGDIAGDEYISVIPDATFAMTQSGKADVTATVSQAVNKFRGDNYTSDLLTDGTEVLMATGATGAIDAQDLTAGAWNGNFNFAIALNQDATN